MAIDENIPNLDVLRRVFDAVGEADVAALRELYTEDYVLELPYAEGGGARIDGREEALAYLERAFSWIRLRLALTDVHACADPDTIVAEYTSTGMILDGRRPYANTYIGVWQFRDGRVRRTREFYGPVDSAS